MKQFITLFIMALAISISNGQNIFDAVRYSMDDVQGTARFQGVSGAFGALGGDMSAVGVNPAGSAIFARSHVSLSLANYDSSKDVFYFDGASRSSSSNLDLNQTGGAFVFRNTQSDSPWKKFVLAVAYEQTQNFDDDFFAFGTNTRSVDAFFLQNAQGLRLDEISAFPGESIGEAYQDIGSVYGFGHQQAFLGYESFIIEPVDNTDGNTSYFSNVAPGSFYQDYSLVSSGYSGKISFNGAVQYGDNVYLGVNINSHFFNYSRSTFFYEENSNPGSLVAEIGFENTLFADGTGLSFQLGSIVKLNESFRLGLTYDSPVWYDIREETTQYLETFLNSGPNGDLIILNPNVVNVYPEYRLKTPGKLTGSLAMVFGDLGFLSLDYSRKDYSNTEFRPTSDSYFANQNTIIANNLGIANTYRIGGELRQKQFSFRGGYRFEESPFESGSFYGDLTGFSLGAGYRFGNFTVDVAYQNSKRDLDVQMFDTGLTDSIAIDQTNENLIFSLSFTL